MEISRSWNIPTTFSLEPGPPANRVWDRGFFAKVNKSEKMHEHQLQSSLSVSTESHLVYIFLFLTKDPIGLPSAHSHSAPCEWVAAGPFQTAVETELPTLMGHLLLMVISICHRQVFFCLMNYQGAGSICTCWWGVLLLDLSLISYQSHEATGDSWAKAYNASVPYK